MQYGETVQQMVEQHIREGKVTLDRQRALINRLGGLNLPLEKSREILVVLERSQALQVAHLGRLLRCELAQ
ncbi:hypothetical protein EN817_25160 [Mesorhizobium sp. M3A.F.Ca.ET.174.01.1.1]|uniref:hypothetical protein n=1 Tax=unclassified Mesorhizobium TaxID=325217 RepID=UPI00109368DA|nr:MULTISPECIES: hypothetical protein [unclassified Mesorhizobium]TGS82733.1 hypothetical protein EN818_25210 [Mesorhizobium sp. M3A.F.Ca.ET.175.01.1.1]TGT22688.1 hypothetical protein EN817_25160 [Mesorhizobium sp. M3A.F.Ca.ET.174.01.1.1]